STSSSHIYHFFALAALRSVPQAGAQFRCAVTMPSVSFIVIHCTDLMTGVARMTAKRSDGEAS
ncbi:MAG: hypothetical protein WBH36_18685, partial [Syntrophobacteria bacterium]